MTMTTSPSPFKLPDTPWAKRVLFRVEVGSTAHGTGLDGVEDYDEIGLMTQPIETLVGLSPGTDTITHRPGRSEGERSGPGDWDLVVHGARKFCKLTASGNPSMIVALFGPRRQVTELGLELLDNHKWFWSQKCRPRFLGYAHSQRERLLGVRGGKHTNRPELIERYGFDTKYAMHMVRLGFQGIEYLQTGRLELPMADARGDLLRSIRQGQLSLDAVIAQAEANEEQLAHLDSDAPHEPNYDAINRWLVKVTR